MREHYRLPTNAKQYGVDTFRQFFSENGTKVRIHSRGPPRRLLFGDVNTFLPLLRERNEACSHLAGSLTDVSRATIYNWMSRGLIHWTVMPNNRRYICRESIVHANTVTRDKQTA